MSTWESELLFFFKLNFVTVVTILRIIDAVILLGGLQQDTKNSTLHQK